MSKIKLHNFSGGTKERLTLIQWVLTYSTVRLGLKGSKELIDELVDGKEIELEIDDEKKEEATRQLGKLKVEFK